MESTKRNNNLLIYIYLADICLLPTWHMMGLPFKFAYLFGFLWLMFYLLKLRFRVYLGGTYVVFGDGCRELKRSFYGGRMIRCVLGIILVTALGELTTALYTKLVDTTSFRNAIFFYIILICSLGIGYVKYDFNKNYLIVVMTLYCAVNILLSALGNSAPSFLLNLYRFSGENEVKLSSLRIVGTMGNPNATLCIMNMLFMSVIVFIRKDWIDIRSRVKLVYIMLLPLITDCFINSRGEFLVTVALEIVLLYTVFQKQKDFFRILVWILIIAIVCAFLFTVGFDYLSQKYPTVAYSLKRITSIFGGDTDKKTDSVSDRPFIHFDEFITRFLKSPIWGTGFSVGSDTAFRRSCQSYHNDWFRIFASGGLIGGGLWIYMIYTAVKRCGIFYILPFFVTAISNTFIGSYAALGIYFITVMVLIRYEEEEKKRPVAEGNVVS